MSSTGKRCAVFQMFQIVVRAHDSYVCTVLVCALFYLIGNSGPVSTLSKVWLKG